MTSNPLDPHTLDRLVSWLEPWGENTPHKEAADAIKALRERVSQLENTAHYQTLKLTLDTSALKLPTAEQLAAQLYTDRMTHSAPMFGPYGYLCGHVCLNEEHHSYEQDPITPTDEYWSIPLFAMTPPPEPGRYPAPTAGMAAAIAAIAAERRRQIEEEGFTAEHDDKYTSGALSLAAACYCLDADMADDGPEIRFAAAYIWPWPDDWWKPSADPRVNLIKAGALIVAELERIARAEAAEPFAWCKEAAKDES